MAGDFNGSRSHNEPKMEHKLSETCARVESTFSVSGYYLANGHRAEPVIHFDSFKGYFL
jgi:hypothetical protein